MCACGVAARLWARSLVWRGWAWLGHAERALGALDAWLGDLPGTLVPSHSLVLSALATRAHCLGQLGRWSQAADQLEALVALDGQRGSHWFNLGYVREQLADAEGAQGAFERALALAPRLDAAWLGLGKALAQQGQWEQAHAAWECHAQRQPLCPDALVCLVRLHAGRADWAAVVPWLDRLRHFDPRQAMALEAWMSGLPATAPPALADAIGPSGACTA